MQPPKSEINNHRNIRPAVTAAAGIGSLVGAVATSSCCVLPLILFTVGASGAWIGALVRLAPFQPYFIAATAASLGCGYWLTYRSGRNACPAGESCRTTRDRLMNSALVVATILVVLAMGFNFVMPLINS
jgi:mercuric ion transport protein